MIKPRLRFAPSPTGSAHIGTVRTAVFDYLYARHTGGAFILRIEDTDRTRYVEGSLEEMMYCLRWMGMQWDEGPEVGGDYGPYFQSERLEHYHKYAGQLIDEGKAYYCYCTRERLDQLRKEQESARQSPGYDRHCRDLSGAEREELALENPKPVIRFKMSGEGNTEFDDIVRGHVTFDNSLQDDFVIIKADGFPTYHFASIVDDRLMKTTHVIRGEDWLPSAPKHLQLYAAFGWEPPVFVHVPNIIDETGKKLSKRSAATEFIGYIKEGYLPDAMLNFLATMGWSSGEDKKIFSREELIEKFTLEGIVKHPAVFDLPKLRDLNGEYIRMMSVEELAELILPQLQAAGYVGNPPSQAERAYLLEVAALIQDRIVVLSDAPGAAAYFYTDEFEYDAKGVEKHFKQESAPALLKSLIGSLEGASDWTIESIEAAIRGAAQGLGLKDAAAIHLTRLAVTGRTGGPGLFELVKVIGRDRVVQRLRNAERRMQEVIA